MALMPVADALDAALSGVTALPEETVAIENAFHRTLARDITALRTQPPAAMSAMDGYAMRAADATTIPSRLRLIGEAAAGRVFQHPIQAGETVRIFTGGVVPAGADAVVIQEDTAREGDHVIINEVPRLGQHIRKAGLDFRQGDVYLTRGQRLSDRDLALAAAMNHPRLPVHRRPRIALLATGDELVMPGATPGDGEVVYSNGYALRVLARQEGGEVLDLGIARDTVEETSAAIRRAQASEADLLITTGGASVGDHDVVKRSLESEGVDMAFWRIAMRPGKPMMHGRLGSMRVLGLPGNPVSSYVCAFLFMVPLIRALSGRTSIHHPLATASLGRDLPANDGRQDYLRASLEIRSDGTTIATPLKLQDSSLLGYLSKAAALVIRPPFAPAARAGEPCSIVTLPA